MTTSMNHGAGRMPMPHSTHAVTLSDMVSQAAYAVVSGVEAAWRRFGEHCENARALEQLAKFDDSHLADIGISRGDLTFDGLAAAAAHRNSAAMMGGRA